MPSLSTGRVERNVRVADNYFVSPLSQCSCELRGSLGLQRLIASWQAAGHRRARVLQRRYERATSRSDSLFQPLVSHASTHSLCGPRRRSSGYCRQRACAFCDGGGSTVPSGRKGLGRSSRVSADTRVTSQYSASPSRRRRRSLGAGDRPGRGTIKKTWPSGPIASRKAPGGNEGPGRRLALNRSSATHRAAPSCVAVQGCSKPVATR